MDSLGNDNASDCIPCPAHSFSLAASGNVTGCKCNAGYTGEDGGPCTACVLGTYKPAGGRDACTLCAAKTYQDTTASTVCTACPTSARDGQQSSSGVGSTHVQNCTFDVASVHARASAACNISIFEQNMEKYRSGIAEVSGADLGDVEILSYAERNSSQTSRRLLSITVEFNFRISVARYFLGSTIDNLAGLQAWVAAQGLPGVTVGEIISTCGAGAEPDPSSNVSCRACEYGKMRCLFCAVWDFVVDFRNTVRFHVTHSERCFAGFYKNATDNSSCVACHNHATTLSRGAFLLSQCTCVPGYYSKDFLSYNSSCHECGLGHWCKSNQHRASCEKVQVCLCRSHAFAWEI